jgi:hypothetical protein
MLRSSDSDSPQMSETAQTPRMECNISGAELNELCRCYRCNCATYPVCTWFGEPCNECVDIGTLHHYQPNIAKPGEHKKGEAEALSISDPRPLTRTIIEEVKTQPTGDCLYEAIMHALNHYVTALLITIKDLRTAASRYQTQDTFEVYRVLSANQPEYRCVSSSRTLRGFKNIMQRCGESVGVEHCLWGDENTLNIFSKLFKLQFAVFNDKGQLVQLVKAARGLHHTVLLRLNRSRKGEEHFSLLRFNGETILQAQEWNWLKNRLGLKPD